MSGTPRPPRSPDDDKSELSEATDLPLTDMSATAGTGDGRDPLLAAIAKAPDGPPPRGLAPGTIVGHGFRIDRRLGAGGMGVVYLARDMTLERDVALKVHRAVGGLDRLQREAVAMARLAHPNVITVHEIGRVGDRLFVAMEYVAGQTLRDWLAAAPRTWREVVAMMRQVGEGLCAAHDAGLVHRDFKPENVLVGPDGRPRVGDFGLVRVVHGAPSLTSSEIRAGVTPALADTEFDGTTGRDTARDDPRADTPDPVRPAPAPTPLTPSKPFRRGPESATLVPAEISTEEPDPDRLTATGAVLGTPAYMAPEQFAGERVDGRADQFAFCVVLYEGLYGQRPFAGRAPGDILRSIEAGEIRVPPPGRRAPRWLRRLIERGLSTEPSQRYPSLRELLAALDRGIRRRAWFAAGAVLAAAAVAVVAIATRPTPAAASPCGDAGADLDALWSPAAHARLTAAATAADPDIGPRVAERIANRLDEFRTAYREAAGRACFARDVEQTWDDDLYHRSRMCLEQSSALVAKVLDFHKRGREAIAQMIFDAAQLPSPERCKRPSQLSGMPVFGAGLVRGTASAALFNAVGEVQNSHDALAVRQAQLDRISRAAEGIQSPVVDARVLFAGALLDFLRSDLDAAQGHAERAFEAARTSGDDIDAAAAAVLLVRILGVEQSKFDAARGWLLQALAEASRDSIDGDDAYTAAAAMASRQGHVDEAVDYAKKAIAKLEELGETNIYAYSFALDQLAAMLDESGHSAESIPIYRRAIALNQQLGGPDNPALFEDYTNLSLALGDTGDSDGAITAARRAVEIAEQWQGVLPAESVAAAFLNLGVAYQNGNANDAAVTALAAARAGYLALPGDQRNSLTVIEADLALAHKNLAQYKDATAEIKDALRLYRELGEADSIEFAQASLTLGDILSDATQCSDAIDVDTAAIAQLRRLAPDSTGWAVGASGIAPCMREAHRTAESQAAIEAALAALAAQPHPRHLEAELRWQLAQDLHDLGRDPAHARATALEARALFVAEDPATYGTLIRRIDQDLPTWP